MSWVKLDDQFFRHPKARAAGADGRALFIASLCYCASQLTNGRIPEGVLPMLVAEAEVKRSTVRRLEEAGLWDCVEGEHWVHDYLDWNPSAEQEKARRADLSRKRSEAGKKGAASRWQDDGKPDGKLPERLPENGDGKSMAPFPSRPTDVVKSSSTTSVLGDDEFWNLVAQRKLNHLKSVGQTITNESAWLRTATANARSEHAERAEKLRREYPTITDTQLADVLNGSNSLLRNLPRSAA